MRPTSLPCLCFLILPVTVFAQSSDWVEFTEVTATHIVSNPDDQVGIVDAEEKDLVVGDLDRDGDPDMVIVRKVPFSTPGGRRNVLFMNEGGVMTDRSATLAPGFLDETDDRDVAIADINNDTWPDVITAATFDDPPRIYINLGNDAGGNWQGLDYQATDARVPTFTPGPKFCAVAAGDLTGDLIPDLYFADYDNDLEDRLLFNDGSGFFTDETTNQLTFTQYESVFGTGAIIADFNEDGNNDILKVSASGSSPPPGSTPPEVRILYGDGNGNFPNTQIAYDDAAYMAVVSDFNRDGRPDLYIVDDNRDVMMVNTSTVNDQAVFQSTAISQSPRTDGFGGNVAVGDLDGDDFDDLYVTDVDTDIPGCDRFPAALQHNGSEQNPNLADPFNGGDRDWLPNGTYDAVIADFNMDGANDLWLGTCTGNRLFFNNRNADPDTVFINGFELGVRR